MTIGTSHSKRMKPSRISRREGLAYCVWIRSQALWKALDWGICLGKKKVQVLVTQSCLTLCNSIDYSPPGSSVHGVLQARILEWVAISFSRGSSQPRDRTWVSYIAGRFFTIWATGDTFVYSSSNLRYRILPSYFKWGNSGLRKSNFLLVELGFRLVGF